MYRTHFDRRRPLAAPVGLARELPRAPVLDLEHAALLADPATAALIEADPTPVPAPEDREGYYGDRHLEYWLSGLCDWRKLRPLLDAAGAPARYLDLGGATGRVARHAAQEDGVETWIADINVNWIDWVDRHFARPVRAYQSRLHPTIPVADGWFSVISAFSVFTHLDCDERQWLLELLRVLRPGGHLYLTVNDEHVWALLRRPEWAWLRASVSRGKDDEAFARLAEGPMPGPRFVWEYSDAEGYNINTFLASNHVRRSWGMFAEVVDYRVAGHGYQSVVVLRKSDGESG